MSGRKRGAASEAWGGKNLYLPEESGLTASMLARQCRGSVLGGKEKERDDIKREKRKKRGTKQR